MEQICADLRAETADLLAVIEGLDEAGWSTPTPAAGTDVKDQIVHLVQGDLAASFAVGEPQRFELEKMAITSGDKRLADVFGTDGIPDTGAQTLAWFVAERERMIALFEPLDPKDRIPWFGPSMSALSFATARLMETWAHGQDVVDALGAERPPTDRLRHICHLGVSTRGWSYANRGMEAPGEAVAVRLLAPNGAEWTWDDGASQSIRGTALDWCMVVTQRRHHRDTGLVAVGDAAEEWLEIAQAFAGAATLTPEGRAVG